MQAAAENCPLGPMPTAATASPVTERAQGEAIGRGISDSAMQAVPACRERTAPNKALSVHPSPPTLLTAHSCRCERVGHMHVYASASMRIRPSDSRLTPRTRGSCRQTWGGFALSGGTCGVIGTTRFWHTCDGVYLAEAARHLGVCPRRTADQRLGVRGALSRRPRSWTLLCHEPGMHPYCWCRLSRYGLLVWVGAAWRPFTSADRG